MHLYWFHCAFDLQYPSRSVYKQVCFFLQGVMGEMGPPGSPVCILSFNLFPGLILTSEFSRYTMRRQFSCFHSHSFLVYKYWLGVWWTCMWISFDLKGIPGPSVYGAAMQGWFQRAPVFKGPSYQGDEAKTPEVCTTMQKMKQRYLVLEYSMEKTFICHRS